MHHPNNIAISFKNLPDCEVGQEQRLLAVGTLRCRQAGSLLLIALLGACFVCLLDARTILQPVTSRPQSYNHARQLHESNRDEREGDDKTDQKSKDEEENDAHTKKHRHKPADDTEHKDSDAEKPQRRDDQKRYKDELGTVYNNGKKVKAVGTDRTEMCMHDDEADFQTDLLVKMLRCECSWEPVDYFGVFLAFAFSLTVMVLFRAKGNRVRNSFKDVTNWFCSCSTLYAVLVATFLGFGRGSCFTWADICYTLGFQLLFCVPCCWCCAWCYSDPDEEVKLKEDDEQCLLCDQICDNALCDSKEPGHVQLGTHVTVTPNSSRELTAR